MARTNSFTTIAGLLAAFAAGLLAGRAIPTAERAASGPGTGDQALIAPQTRDAEANGQRRRFQTVRDEKAPRPTEPDPERFRFDRLVIDTKSPSPRACLQFSRDLDASGETNYADYVSLSPAVKPAIEVAGAELCLTGLEYDADYVVELRPGLPAEGSERLARGDRVAVAFGDKPAYVGFAGEGVILPRLESDGLGIETVNVETIAIEILRVSDRSLARKEIVEGGALGENNYYYVYGDEDGSDVGAPVYEGEIDVAGEPNEATTTVFPLGAALPDLKPGAYFIRARDASPGADEYRSAQAWRWVIFTDIALTTFSSDSGVDIFARSIETARPLSGIELSLIAANNDLLATTRTNAEGRARFDGPIVNGAPPLNPRMIMAYGPQSDFTAIDLQRAPLDLSDRNVGGRAPARALDAFVYFDRGVYRPGETVRLTGLLRNAAGVAAAERPLTVTIRRPNDVKAFERRIEAFAVGGFSLDYEIPTGAPRRVERVAVDAARVAPLRGGGG